MKIVIRTILAFSIVCLLPGCGFENRKLSQLDEYLDSIHTNGNFDGSVAIGTAEGLVYEKAVGLADRELGQRINTNTRFDICSLNKSFQAYMILQLVQAGILELDDPISRHLDYTGSYADEITIHQMLTHTSGIGSYEAVPDSLKKNNFIEFKKTHFDPESYLEFISGLEPRSKPGKQFYYSNFAYHLLALLLEEKMGNHFSFLLDSMICQPLGLESTYAPLNNEEVYENLALSYLPRENVFVRSPYIDYSLGRRIFSTSADLVRWGQEMLNPTLVSEQLVEQMHTNHTRSFNTQISYGYGWAVFDGRGSYEMGRLNIDDQYLIHGGATDGYRSLLTIYQDGKWIVSHLSNVGDKVDELQLTKEILNILNE